MISSLYRKTFSILIKRPFKLWGLSLLVGVLCAAASIGFVGVPAVSFGIGLLLSASMALVYLQSYRSGTIPAAADLFTAFRKDRLWRVLGGMAWRELWVILWGLLPLAALLVSLVTALFGVIALSVLFYLATAALMVFPLIRQYRYLSVPYILMTQPEIKATDALRISTEQTNGYKGKLFLADILPHLLVLVAGFLLGLFGKIPYLGVLFKICQVVLTIAYCLLAPLFFGLLHAAFYDEIQAQRRAPQPSVPDAPVSPAAPVAPDAPQAEAPAAPVPAELPAEAVSQTSPDPEAPEVEPARFCTNCGAPITAEGAAFCTVCGHRFAD